MFNFIKKLINRKNEDSAEFKLKFAERIKNKKIRYVSERVTDAKS